MSWQELTLVLSGSFIHLGWNILAKSHPRHNLFLSWALCFAGFFPTLCLLWSHPAPVLLPQELFWVMGSALLHFVYFSFLAQAFEHKVDLSFVYPFGRGIGALFSALGGFILLNDVMGTWALIGLLTILLGTFIEPFWVWKFQTKRHSPQFSSKQFFLSLFTGLSIAGYLIWDKIALEYISTEQLLGPMLLTTSFFMLIRTSVVNSESIRLSKSDLLKAGLGGGFIFGSYQLILKAMETAPLSFVTAARSSGIIFSAWSGVIFFKERLGAWRTAGITLIAIGLVFLSIKN